MGSILGVFRAAPGDPVFKKRVVSATCLGLISISLVVLGGHAFAIFVAAFSAAMAWEWVRMSDKDAPPRAFAIATGTAVGACLLAAQNAYGWTLFWVLAGAIGSALDRRPRGGMVYALSGATYIASSGAVLVSLRHGLESGLEAVLFLLAVVWAADIFAYLFGSWIGGPKLLPVASPNKTWVGLIAGLAGGLVAGALCLYLLKQNIMLGLLIAAPTALFAIAGDLLMSLAKRRFGVKDAGTLIPGHGGVLDRVDALMLATLFAGLVVVTDRGLWPGAGL